MFLNAQSLNNKIDNFMTLLGDKDIDFAGVSETWLSSSNNASTAVLKSFGYSIIHNHRTAKRGGGTAIIHKSEFQAKKHSLSCKTDTIEFTCSSFKSQNHEKLAVLIIYRTGQITRQFFNDFNALLADVSSQFDQVLLAGDFNIHFEDTINAHSIGCLEIAKFVWSHEI